MQYPVKGSGLGLRRAFISSLADHIPSHIEFMEVAEFQFIVVPKAKVLSGCCFHTLVNKRQVA